AEAQRLLAQLALSAQDGRVTVTGPGGDSWMGYLIIQAPNGAAMEPEAENSPIGVNSIRANIEARNQNGPLTLRDVDGQVRADVQNRPNHHLRKSRRAPLESGERPAHSRSDRQPVGEWRVGGEHAKWPDSVVIA